MKEENNFAYCNKNKNSFIKFAGKEKDVDEIMGKKAKKNIDKFLSIVCQHEKERLQSGQQPDQANQSSQSSKKEYPWGIIGGMGAVIAVLLGIVIFLLVRIKSVKKSF